MVKVSTKFDEFALLLNEKEFKNLALNPSKEYEFKKINPETWILTEKKEPKLGPSPVSKGDEKFKAIDEKLFNLIKTKPLKDRVEKRFETLLDSKEELDRFKQLVKEGKIVPFKLSEKYKRAVYKLKEEVEQAGKKNVPGSGSDFERKGFALLQEPSAIIFSQKNESRIKSGEILGVKSFDNKYYVISKELFEKHSPKVLNYLQQNKNAPIEEIVEDTHLGEDLAKIICELLKEKGDLLEKRKGVYQYIG